LTQDNHGRNVPREPRLKFANRFDANYQAATGLSTHWLVADLQPW
jgi:hypothetical protein